MDTKRLIELAVARKKLDAKVKADEAALKEKLKPLKAKRDQVDEVLGKIINKSGEKGCMKSFKLPDDSIVYASEVDKYSTKDRNELDAWVLQPLALYLELEADALGDEADAALEDLVQAINDVHNRMGIFSNTVVKDSAIAYRKDTGASDVEGDLTGGKLPGGIGMYKERKVNFRKGS